MNFPESIFCTWTVVSRSYENGDLIYLVFDYSARKSMEERVEEENTAQDTPKSCSAISSAISPKKEGIVQTHEIDEEFLSPTPVKTREPPRIKSKEEIAELPAK